MILPAKHADVIRSMADGGGKSAAPPPQINFNATPMPGGFFMAHKTELAKVMKAAYRDFDLRGAA